MSERYGNLPDEELMQLCSDGDNQALDHLFRRYQHPIYNYCLRFLRDPTKADDVLQETFLRLYSNRTSWKPMAKFSSWLYRIARNLCVDETRRYPAVPCAVGVAVPGIIMSNIKLVSGGLL